MVASNRLDYLLKKAQVPLLHRRNIRRKVYDRFENFMQSRLDKGDFFVLLDGIAGTGKTNLVCEFLWNRSDVCGYYFKKIIWLTDRSSDPKQVISLGSEALLLLSKELSSGLISVDEKDTSTSRSQCDDFLSCQRPQMMKIMLSKRLAENPKTLIILDGVLLQETVDLFAGLDCSIIATSTRPEIFDHIDNCESFHLNMNDVYFDDVIELCKKYDIDSVGEHSAREIIRQTGGNFALMEKLLTSAQSNTQKLEVLLDQLQFGQLDTVKCVSYYQYSSLNTSFDTMTKMIDSRFTQDLPTLAILQPSTWIDIDIVSLVWPVDMPDGKQSKLSLLVGKDMSQLSRNCIVEHQIQATTFNDQTRIEPILHYYLLSVGDSKSLLSTLQAFKRDLHQENTVSASTAKSFKKYWIDNENSILQLEAILKQPKCRKNASAGTKHASSGFFSNWLTYFWSK